MPVWVFLYQLTTSLFTCAGRSPDHIVCCLSRDSYGTGVFLQELMSALSLQQQLPPPEPSDQDFYSQFTNTNTGNSTAQSGDVGGNLRAVKKNLQGHNKKVPAFHAYSKIQSRVKLPCVTSQRSLIPSQVSDHI